MKSQVALPLLGIISVLALIAAFFLRPLPSTITPEIAGRITPGMTFEEVVVLLGVPRDEVGKSDPRASIAMIGHHVGHGPIEDADLMLSKSLFLWVDRQSWTSEFADVEIDFSRNNPGKISTVVKVDVKRFEFPSSTAYLHWRVRRVLGQAPDTSTFGKLSFIRVPRETR